MNDSQKAIEELKKAIKRYYLNIAEGEDLLSLLDRVEQIIDRTYTIASENNLTLEITMLEVVIPQLVKECIKSLEKAPTSEAYLLIVRIRDVAISGYFSISKEGLRSELELKQLSDDIEILNKKKKALEQQIDDYKTLINLRNHLNSYNEEAFTIVDQAKVRNQAVFDLLDDARTKYKIIEDILVSAEDAQNRQNLYETNLSSLDTQSSEMSERIKGILGDVNRDSMAASFKERKDELTKSVWIYDGVNYAALAIIAGIAMYAFTSDTEFSLKLIYERLLIALPFGFISWFASRRSQYLFQLKEDYAYKYSSAMAFEGYKRQAEANPEMHDELLKIAITNLGRTPTSVFDKDLKHAPTDKVVDAIKDAIPKIK